MITVSPRVHPTGLHQLGSYFSTSLVLDAMAYIVSAGWIRCGFNLIQQFTLRYPNLFYSPMGDYGLSELNEMHVFIVFYIVLYGCHSACLKLDHPWVFPSLYRSLMFGIKSKLPLVFSKSLSRSLTRVLAYQFIYCIIGSRLYSLCCSFVSLLYT